jgi:hypothetical protein
MLRISNIHFQKPSLESLKMKTFGASLLFAGLAAAHSAVWNITFDGNMYVHRDSLALII